MCLPGLHISLGVFKKIFDHLELSCLHLDKQLQLRRAADNGELGEGAFETKVQLLRDAVKHKRKAMELKETAHSLEEMLALFGLHSDNSDDEGNQARAAELLEEIKKVNHEASQEVI